MNYHNITKQVSRKEKAFSAIGSNATCDMRGVSEDTLKNLKYFWNYIPKIEKPYTKLLADIKQSKRIHLQSTFGDKILINETEICGVSMCTAGHFVQMGGIEGFNLMLILGFKNAYELI